MTNKEFKELQRGDIITSLLGARTFIVTANYGGRVTAVATVDITNPIEWSLRLKADYKDPKEDLP